jgi:hypothetical protein
MTKTQAKRYVEIFGFVGLVSVIFSLTSATVRFPGTTFSVFTGITPVIGVELIHNKTELVSILGPADSENRKVIANRPWGLGWNLASAFALFFFGMYKLQRRFRPDLKNYSLVALILLVATLALEYEVVLHLAAAAKAPDITDKMVGTIRDLVFLKWNALFVAALCSCVWLLATPGVLGVGGDVLMGGAVLGSFAMSYHERLIAPILLVMFVGICGVSVLLVLWPEIVYEFDPLMPVVDEPEG